jgi:hypothetical protein
MPPPAAALIPEAIEEDDPSPVYPEAGAQKATAHEPHHVGEQSALRRKRKRGALGKEVLPLKQVSINNFFRK